MKTQWLPYLATMFFYRTAQACILLVTGWDILKSPGQSGLLALVVMMTLSYAPAAFARPVYFRLSAMNCREIAVFAWLSSAALMLSVLYTMHTNLPLFFLCYSVMWMLMFLGDISLEKWFVESSQKMDLSLTRQFSGIVSAATQIGFLCGPLFLMLTERFNPMLPYWGIFAGFLLAAFCASLEANINIFSIGKFKRKKSHPLAAELLKKREPQIAATLALTRIKYTLAFSLVLPTLNIVNMLLPILARAPFYHSIDVSCTLEIVFGIAAVTAGLTHGYVTEKINSVFRTAFFFLVLVVGSITAYLYEKNFAVVIVCFSMVSIGFNHFRADLRAHFAKKFDADIAGEILAIANSWSLPIIIVYAACFYFISLYDTHSKITLMFPAGYMLSAGWFIYVLNSTYAQKKNDGI